MPRLFYYCIYDKKEDAEKNKNAVFTYPKGYETGKDNDKYTKVDMKSDASDEDVEKELDEELDGFFAKDNRYNYYLQLKIAKETTLNKSIGQAAVKIGVPWERKEKKCKECVCKKYNLVWGGKVTCEFRKKVVEICTELWGEDRKIEMANGLMAVMNAETSGSFKAQQVEGWKSVKTPSEMTIADFRINGAQCSSRAVGLIQFTQVALEALGEYVSNKALTKEQKFDELNKVKLRFAQMGEIKQLDYVKQYFEKVASKIKTPEDIYLHVFAPIGVGQSEDFVLYKSGTDNYNANQSVDTDNDGIIRRREILSRYYKSFNEGKNNRGIKGCPYSNEKKNSGKWHDPVDNPALNHYNSSSIVKPESALFGDYRNRTPPFHSGIDLFALPGSPIYACLDGKVVNISNGGNRTGWMIIIQIDNTKDLLTQLNKNYQCLSKERMGTEIKETDTVYLMYLHIFKNQLVKNGDTVSSGQQIGYSSVTGFDGKLPSPHLHFEIRTKVSCKGTGDKYRTNPARFLTLHPHDTPEQDEAVKYLYFSVDENDSNNPKGKKKDNPNKPKN